MRKHVSAFLALILIFLGGTNQAFADFIALTFSGGTTFGLVNDPTPNTIGWEFSTSSSIFVTSLGFFDLYHDGLTEDHIVSIWDVSSKNQVATANVKSTDTLENAFRWSHIEAVLLTAGTYRIGASTNGLDHYCTIANDVTTSSPVKYIDAVYKIGFFDYPDSSEPLTINGRFGPNFKFYEEAPTVPEPSTALLLIFGLTGIALAGRKRRVD